jgi:capsular exopolysaccharide synthesis family protein
LNQQPQNNQKPIDLLKLGKRVLNKWYILAVCIMVFTAIAYFYNKYSLPAYRITSTIEINQNRAQPVAMIFDQTSSIVKLNQKDEIEKLKSIPVLLSTINDLNFAVSYYYENPIHLIELYRDSPVKLTIDAESESVPYGEMWLCNYLDEQRYQINTGENTYTFSYKEKANINDFIFSVELTDPGKFRDYGYVKFKVNKLFDLIMEYRAKLDIKNIFDDSYLFQINVVGTNMKKELDFVVTYLEKIVQYDINRKRAFSEKTVGFIDEQIAENTDSLLEIEGDIKQFKYTKVPVDPTSETNQLYSNIQQLEQEKANILLSNQYYDYLLTSLNQSKDIDEIVVPAAMGIQDNILNQLISRLVELQLDVKLLMTGNKGKNPLLQETQDVIRELKTNILTNVNNLKATNGIRLKDIENRIDLFASSLKQLPEAERELRTIQRDYRLNEEIYLLLMQRRLEAGIKFASIDSDYNVINNPYNAGKVNPGPIQVYLLAFLLGLALPAGLIMIMDIMSDKVKSKDELESMISLPIVGSIIHKSGKKLGYYQDPGFESFRSLRTNLKFLKQPTRVLLFTSFINGEGKTYCSTQTAITLAMGDKKVLWIDADLRKVKKSYGHVREEDAEKGLTSYLSGIDSLNEIVLPHKVSNLHVIKTGMFPPNPGELLINDRMKQLIDEFKNHFDYIILDSPPLGFFSDAFELITFVDHTFLVVRENHSKRSAIKSVLDLINANNLIKNNLSLIYNDFSSKQTAYGYGYSKGYYGKKPKSKVVIEKNSIET